MNVGAACVCVCVRIFEASAMATVFFGPVFDSNGEWDADARKVWVTANQQTGWNTPVVVSGAALSVQVQFAQVCYAFAQSTEHLAHNF